MRAGSRYCAATRLTSSQRHGLDARHELLEIRVGQAVQRQLRDTARHLLRRLEAARIAARHRRSRQRELVGGRRACAANLVELAQRLANRRRP